MENSNKRHGKKSDKETQSPVIKVFKEMIQRENNDPEKANLLKEKQERKRRQYSGSRSKLDRANRSCDSSSSEKIRRNVQYKVVVHDQRSKEYINNNQRLPSLPFEGDKKDSWWFWRDTTQKKPSEDTCSCVSCALKKIVGSEYTCIACLGVLFLLSVLVAFMLLFRAVPASVNVAYARPSKRSSQVGSDLLKRKIDQIQRGSKDDDDRALWDDTRTRHLSSLTGLHGNDFDDGSYRELNAMEDSGRSDSELSGILDAEKLNDGLSSEKLRSFYKKLLRTDAQIRNLKKGVNEYAQTGYENTYSYADRSKRSLRMGGPKPPHHRKAKRDSDGPAVLTKENLAEIQKFNIFYPPYLDMNGTRKSKRHANASDEPMGFLIEKKQILVQYKPHDVKKVPKCSHAPKDSKSHEKQLKHPFYKNTQRFDELLDQLLDKNLPEMIADPFGVEMLFKNEQKDFKTHKTNVKIEKEKVTKKPFVMNKVKNVKAKDDKLFQINRAGNRVGELDRKFFDMVSKEMKGKYSSTSSTPDYDVILSVSTIVNPGFRKITKPMNTAGQTPSLLERVPHLRKLLQVNEEDEEGLGYEDLKEVLADDNDTHDETEKGQERNKRMDDYKFEDLKMSNIPYNKYNPPGIHNPNWKGPMPLYPDELTSMIKQAAIQNVQSFNNKIHIPATNIKEMSSESADSDETDLNDMEYIESYSDKRFQKLAKMAQAYSDYGVLEGKKDSARNEKAMDGKNAERRVKLSVTKRRSLKNALSDRFKKRDVSEGIRFEIRPTTPAREDSPVEVMKLLEKHVKVTNNRYFPPFHSTTLPSNTEYALFSSLFKQNVQSRKASCKRTGNLNDYPSNAAVFTFAKSGRRSLKSVEENPVDNLAQSDNATIQHSALILKGISGTDLKNFGDSVNTEKSIETKVANNGHHHHQDHHSEHRHCRNKSDGKETDENFEKFKGRTFFIVNETIIKRVKENLTKPNNASDDKVKKAIVVPDNNLISTILNLNAPKNSSEMALSDFFMLMSNWFSVLAGFETSSESNEPKSNIIELTTKSKLLDTTHKSNESLDTEFPMYDSDMIENIAHRSRVLMSVEENDRKPTNVVDTSEASSSAMNGKDEGITSGSTVIDSKEDTNTPTAIASTTGIVTENTTPSNNEVKLSSDKNEIDADNKTVVKRNVPDDSNLIFWNDIYDDEYGVKLDPIDDAISDRQYSRSVDFVKRSGNWIQDKMKNFANNFRGKDKIDNNDRNLKKRVIRRATEKDPRYTYTKYKRAAKDEAEPEDKTGFAELTMRMKEVCKEAANAVKQTRNIQVRQDEKEDSMTMTLMQQLVRLMTDLIDFQVQQKTCVKLPPDLQEFLVWLTAPNSEQVDYRNQKTSYNEGNSFEKASDQTIDLVTTPSSEKEDLRADSRSECLGTLHAVQDLMNQYDEMTDEDKSKMTGIRNYLENQLQFLHKQLALFGDNSISDMFGDQNNAYRFRRDLQTEKHSNRFRRTRNFRNRFKRRFLKNFGKKHTRSTVSVYDGFSNTDVYKFSNNKGVKETGGRLEQRDTKNVKRNLKDVYYKAVNDAKKSTTFKSTVKDELEGFDHAQIVRIDN